jgi:hypothetical protein
VLCLDHGADLAVGRAIRCRYGQSIAHPRPGRWSPAGTSRGGSGTTCVCSVLGRISAAMFVPCIGAHREPRAPGLRAARSAGDSKELGHPRQILRAYAAVRPAASQPAMLGRRSLAGDSQLVIRSKNLGYTSA